MNSKIKLSIIVTARNDDYGGNLVNRINTFVKVLTFFVEKYKIQSELIIVEYNPLPSKPRLFSEITKGKENRFLKHRFIEVPKTFHEKYFGNTKIPVLEFLAKNIGIRRAHGDYILSTNPDIILCEEFFSWFSQEKLDNNTYYRTNRHDITCDRFDLNFSVQKILALAKSHVFMIFFNTETQYKSWIPWLKRFLISRKKRSFMMCPIFNKKTDGADQKIIHERAAGDFLLMHHSLWEKVGGYDQEPTSGFLDSYILFVLYCYNVKQIILSFPIYHINHKIGRSDRPGITLLTFNQNVKKMLNDKIPYKKYNKDWGFPEEIFSETN